MVTFEEWLNRKKAGPKPRKPIRKVAKRRVGPQREYGARRVVYLLKHPFCQIFMKRFKCNELIVIANNGVFPEVTAEGNVHWIRVPHSSQIHHSRKPKCKYLNDESTWFAACDEQHKWVEDHKNLARRLGLLHDN